jgi:hypothetical protein
MASPLWYILTMTWEPYQDAAIKRLVREKDDDARKILIDRWLEAKIQEVEIMSVIVSSLYSKHVTVYAANPRLPRRALS